MFDQEFCTAGIYQAVTGNIDFVIFGRENLGYFRPYTVEQPVHFVGADISHLKTYTGITLCAVDKGIEHILLPHRFAREI